MDINKFAEFVAYTYALYVCHVYIALYMFSQLVKDRSLLLNLIAKIMQPHHIQLLITDTRYRQHELNSSHFEWALK